MNSDILEKNKIKILGKRTPDFDQILTPDALDFLKEIQEKFGDRRKELLKKRIDIQSRIDEGHFPDFDTQTSNIREGNWTVSPIPKDLQDRRVEITGPVDRKMIINALNSNVKVFMADFEDSNSPTWENNVNGQINLRDAVNKTITFTNPINSKFYKLNEEIATLMVRPRGWHLEEKNVTLNGEPISASIFDFALYFYHNVKPLLKNGSGPYFYLPKLESHLEARLWNDIFIFAQERLQVPVGTIKATVLIENILAAFEMDEILYELKEHSVGLNCGRWDYIFSFIKKFKNFSNFVLPDRSEVTMSRHFLSSYVKLLVYTCHKRGAHAMGGMAAQIPIKNDEKANQEAMTMVKNDKKREASAGHDGTWVAHPGLSIIALEAFNEEMPEANQIHRKMKDPQITAEDLLKVPTGNITKKGLRHNIKIGLQYLEAWLSGNGCVPLYNLMEDAATAEISRTQLWQWIKHTSEMDNDEKITVDLFLKIMGEELSAIEKEVGTERFSKGKFKLASELFEEMIISDNLDEFLTLPAYEHII